MTPIELAKYRLRKIKEFSLKDNSLNIYFKCSKTNINFFEELKKPKIKYFLFEKHRTEKYYNILKNFFKEFSGVNYLICINPLKYKDEKKIKMLTDFMSEYGLEYHKSIYCVYDITKMEYLKFNHCFNIYGSNDKFECETIIDLECIIGTYKDRFESIEL